ncbi:MAG: helix-turn-helix domain-containing protein, partial [Enterococcus lemanii]
KSNRLISGSLVLIPPNILHTSYRIGEKVCRYSCIVFSCEFIASRMDDSIQKEILQPLFLDDFSENYITSIIELDLKETWHILSQCLSSQDISEYLKVKGLLLQMIAEIILTKKESSFKRKEESIRAFREKEILKYIEETYSEVLHLADLADVLNLSKEQFSRFFRQSFRQSPMQYLKEFRLQKASQLLINTNLSVEEIAGLTGFDNGNYFSRVFKSNLKVAPTKFREMTRSC